MRYTPRFIWCRLRAAREMWKIVKEYPDYDSLEILQETERRIGPFE